MTQCERIVDVLRDGREHTAAELYRTGCVLHSRISDLRKRGYVIELSRTDGVGAESFLYRLVSAPKEMPSAGGVSLGVSVIGADSGCLPAEPETPIYIEGQIDIFDALGAVA